MAAPDAWQLTVDGAPQAAAATYDAAGDALTIEAVQLPPGAALACTLSSAGRPPAARRDRTTAVLDGMLRAFHLDIATKTALRRDLPRLAEQPELLDRYAVTLSAAQRRALLEVALQAGVHHVRNLGVDDLLVLWNNPESNRLTCRYTVWDSSGRGRHGGSQGTRSVLPAFRAIVPPAGADWKLAVDYAGVVTVEISGP